MKDTLENRGIQINIKKYGMSGRDFTPYSHVWIEHNGKHYDVECPSGVTDASKLPIFDRGDIKPLEK